MRLDTRIFRVAWLALACAILLVRGCDNTIEPFSEKGTYSIYGVLWAESRDGQFAARDRQFVRIKPLPVPVTKVDSSSLEARVGLENQTKGESVEMPLRRCFRT